MKTLIIFYSYSGKTKEIAENLAKEKSADIIEVKEMTVRSKIKAYSIGCLAAMQRKMVDLQPFNSDLTAYEKIIIAMPIWAGYPAPAINNIIHVLPKGKMIELIMTSGSGNSKKSEAGTKALIEAQGCHVVSYRDMKGMSQNE